MPIVLQPDNLAAMFAAIDSRLRRLETYGQVAMKDIAPASWPSTGGLGFSTAYVPATGTNTPAFTLTRPQTVMLLGATSFYITGGTANYGYLRLAIINNATGSLAAPTVGNATSSAATATASTGLAIVGNGQNYLVATLPAGTYYAQYQYKMDSGATTTLVLGTSQGGGGTLDVFLLGG